MHREEHDVRTVAEVSTESSREVVLDSVIETAMRMMLLSAGATGAQLMLAGNGALTVRARAEFAQDLVVQLGPASKNDPLVSLIANTVERSGQSLTLNTASDMARMFTQLDAPARVPRSVFCLPLFIERRLAAVLYLEHDRVDRAFPPKKRALIESLSSQIAVAFANARHRQTLYDENHPRSAEAAPSADVQLELIQASRAAAIGELVASIIHEMSQPLSAIDASSGAALRWLQREVPNLDEAALSLEKVRGCTVKAKAIIDRLRELNRQSQVQFASFDVHAAIRDVVAMSRARIEQFDTQITVLGMDGEQPLFGNRVQIQQVVENLIANSLEAMVDTTCRARTIHISSARTDCEIVISVLDSGPGISLACESRLFRPFVTTKPQAMGLGLAICKRIVEAHSGRMWMQKGEPFGMCVSFAVESA
ncbi:ATP-binding protein [Paraburkholderia sp. GAS199]|uniref:ATP-binding protein n=1 Tax=Paraburkholderia sp. GAS199 TaxID=3035126 RepID=UPI003D197ABF